MSATAHRPRLTPHQAEVLDRLVHLARWRSDGWVRAEAIGSAGALDRLVRKGYVERSMEYGPRGGERPLYRPVTP